MLRITRTPEMSIALGFNIIGSKQRPRLLSAMFASIAPIADQIVVIADENADAAFFAIAHQYTPHVYQHKWKHDFAYARNLALSKTRTPYVAWIDTDEVMRGSVMRRMGNLMTRPDGKAYYIWQVSPTSDGSEIYVPQVRLFPNVPGVQWEIPIHEQVLPSLARQGVKTQLTDLRVDHFGYADPAEIRAKNRRNMPILIRRLRQHPEDDFTRRNYERAVAYQKGA